MIIKTLSECKTLSTYVIERVLLFYQNRITYIQIVPNA